MICLCADVRWTVICVCADVSWTVICVCADVRWTVIFHPYDKEKDVRRVDIQNSTNDANTNEDTSSMFVMNNYFGIGVDAELSLDFHEAREANPDKFNSRLHNKGVYLKMGLRKILKWRGAKELQRLIRVEVDGKVIDLPPVEGLIILNIPHFPRSPVDPTACGIRTSRAP